MQKKEKSQQLSILSGPCVIVAILLIVLMRSTFFSPAHSSLLWQIVLFLSLASAFVLTALTLADANKVWNDLASELQKQQASALFLGEQKDAIQLAFFKEREEREKLMAHLGAVKQELIDKEEASKSNIRLVDIVREELKLMHAQQEALLQELFDVRRHAAALENQSREAFKNTPDDIPSSRPLHQEDTTVKIQELNDYITMLMAEKNLLENTLSTIQGEMEELHVQVQRKVNGNAN